MNCPICTNVPLALSERQGIEIDYCPTWRGVWLDRGELDKLIDRADSAYQRYEARTGGNDDDDDREGGEILGGFGRRGGGRRESMLGDFFDFG